MLTYIQEKMLLAIDKGDIKLDSLIEYTNELSFSLIKLKDIGLVRIIGVDYYRIGMVWNDISLTGKGQAMVDVIK